MFLRKCLIWTTMYIVAIIINIQMYLSHECLAILISFHKAFYLVDIIILVPPTIVYKVTLVSSSWNHVVTFKKFSLFIFFLVFHYEMFQNKVWQHHFLRSQGRPYHRGHREMPTPSRMPIPCLSSVHKQPDSCSIKV